MRRFLRALLVTAGALAAAILYRRRFSRRRDRVDLYFEDGSMVTVEEGSPDGERLLPIARRALQAAA